MGTILRINGWRQAVRDYRRLCQAGASGPYNETSALQILREALPSVPELHAIMCVLAIHGQLSARQIEQQMPGPPRGNATVQTELGTLLRDGMVTREFESLRLGGWRWRWSLSPLGMAVMGSEKV
jgi:hypothetical protein